MSFNSDFILGNFRFSVLFKSFFVETKLKNHLAADIISDFSENTTLDFVLFYQKIINTASGEAAPGSATARKAASFPLTPAGCASDSDSDRVSRPASLKNNGRK